MTTTPPSDDPLAAYKDTVIHLFVHDRMLREQMRIIVSTLGFSSVTLHDVNPSYSQSAQQLAQLILKQDGLFLINPNLEVVGDGGKVKVRKELPDYFRVLSILLQKARRDPMGELTKCVPVFEDIQFMQKREKILLSLAEFGVTGAFILKQQESLVGVSTATRKKMFQEQIMERYAEIKEYLIDYFASKEDNLEALKERKEEQDLYQRKQKAEKWVAEAVKYKEAGDLEKTIACYRKAIELYPDDPDAFLESGRAYVRLHKYPHALKYFRHAEDIAENLPEPNKEIANVRIQQVRERMEKGESPTSPEIMALLNEAAENYQNALSKASQMAAKQQEEGEEKSQDAMARIAGEIFKHELDEVLGRNHPMLGRLGSIAREALEELGSKNINELPPQQQIFLGLSATDEGNFAEAEMYLFRALEDEELFSQACDNINFLGTVVRKRDTPTKAVALYRRLLAKRPPNRAAVHYNMALALIMDKQEVEAAGHLVQSIYQDPGLPRRDEFYMNKQLFPVITLLLEVLDGVVEASKTIEVDPEAAGLVELQEELEFAIMDNDDQTAYQLLFNAVAKVKPFFQRMQPYASSTIMNYIDLKTKTLLKSPKENVVKFGKVLVSISRNAAKYTHGEDYLDYVDYRAQCLHILGSTGDQPEASNRLGMALAAYPDVVKDPDFFANKTFVNFSIEIQQKMSSIDRERLG